MKLVLVPFDHEGATAQLQTALLTARVFGSHCDGVAPRALLEYAFYGEGFSTALDEWEREEEAKRARCKDAFRAFMETNGLQWSDPGEPSQAPAAGWITDIERGDVAIGQLARLYEVTVLARPVSTSAARRYSLLETVLFESGRPILIAPGAQPEVLGRVVVIAWNGSTESARAIAFARPFLERAEQVHIVAVEGGMVAGPGARQLQAALRRTGIEAGTRIVGQEGRSVGEAILQETAMLKGDLLIKGAYTHSRLRQMVFGGATSHILNEATVPVLMAH